MPKNLYSIIHYFYISQIKLWRNTYEFRRRRKNNAFDTICKS